MKNYFFALIIAVALGFGIAAGAGIFSIPVALADGR